MAEIDDVKAATTARTVTKVKRILSEDVIWDLNLKEEDVQPFYADLNSDGYDHASLIHRIDALAFRGTFRLFLRSTGGTCRWYGPISKLHRKNKICAPITNFKCTK
ncbi:hypothetical protein CY34DRAFT_327425 [Suillus luteus UH-Slu-Lm8-n1]|uniref:Uncharacterized protein n=1 Tax=Suillus luteus UH-Slu-Lm8-n1 TaxID=930992 RepID=A0A0D0AZ12_9AGAM|nr:hypothetical protein CY34DRAFT_327425 [Suillus luteus UH-Slu-Lm8-n1]